jgi:heme/copper-type cytochrome/quinol oxidase subunit 4
MDNGNILPQGEIISEQGADSDELTASQKRMVIGAVVGIILVLILTIISIIFLLQPSTDTARIRDVFIIFLALGSLLVGLAFIILMIQLARLINLIQNEIKPILDSTDETLSNIRGTTTFLSDNLAEPVIKMNEYSSGVRQFFQILGLFRRNPKD